MELIGLGAAFLAVFIIVFKYHNITWALTAGIIIIVLSSGEILESAATVESVILSIDTWQLVLIVVLISLLSRTAQKTGLVKYMIDALHSLLRSVHLLFALIPLIMGMMAVPGGVVMSAPAVDQLGNRLNMRSEQRTSLNLFFFHLPPFIYPLIPAFIVATNLSGLDMVQITRFNLFPVLAGAGIGILLLFRRWPQKAANREEVPRPKPVFGVLKNIVLPGSPFIAAIILGIGFRVNFIIALAAALVLVVLVDAYLKKKIDIDYYRRLFQESINWQIGLTIFIILIFGAFVRDSEMIVLLENIVIQADISLLVLLVLISMVTGFFSGSPLVGAAIVYPIFLPLVPAGAEGTACLALIYTCLLYGYILSPVHLCVVLSNNYFNVKYADCLRLLFPLQTVTLVSAILTAIFLY